MTVIYSDPGKRHDFVLIFDVTNGNPNGDPDAGNLPRVDPETMHGLVTDVAIKRKVRNFVDFIKGGTEGYRIYIQNKEALNNLHQQAYDAKGIKSTGKKQKRGDIEAVKNWMCQHFYDIRLFGAVMTTGVNAGQVRGPVQLTMARSVDPITPIDMSITRTAITKQEDMDYVEADDNQKESGGKTTEMGRKPMVPYGLYIGYGFYSPFLGEQTGVSEDDLELFWQALVSMWDLDRSASRGLMACRGLYVMSHDSPLGNAPAHELFERIRVSPKDPGGVARSFGDYSVEVGDSDLPPNITLTRLVG